MKAAPGVMAARAASMYQPNGSNFAQITGETMLGWALFAKIE